MSEPAEIFQVLVEIRDALRANATRATVDPEGLSMTEAAQFLGISTAKLHQLDSQGLLPEPARLGTGNCPRFTRTELRAWMLAGCPSRVRWAQLRDAALRRTG